MMSAPDMGMAYTASLAASCAPGPPDAAGQAQSAVQLAVHAMLSAVRPCLLSNSGTRTLLLTVSPLLTFTPNTQSLATQLPDSAITLSLRSLLSTTLSLRSLLFRFPSIPCSPLVSFGGRPPLWRVGGAQPLPPLLRFPASSLPFRFSLSFAHRCVLFLPRVETAAGALMGLFSFSRSHSSPVDLMLASFLGQLLGGGGFALRLTSFPPHLNCLALSASSRACREWQPCQSGSRISSALRPLPLPSSIFVC
jgi:hypothetical protein